MQICIIGRTDIIGCTDGAVVQLRMHTSSSQKPETLGPAGTQMKQLHVQLAKRKRGAAASDPGITC